MGICPKCKNQECIFTQKKKKKKNQNKTKGELKDRDEERLDNIIS